MSTRICGGGEEEATGTLGYAAGRRIRCVESELLKNQLREALRMG